MRIAVLVFQQREFEKTVAVAVPSPIDVVFTLTIRAVANEGVAKTATRKSFINNGALWLRCARISRAVAPSIPIRERSLRANP